MQEVTATICANTPTYDDSHKTYALTDARDNKKYLVRKLADNRCWMVQNLALEGNTKLSSADSDLPTGETYTTPDGTDFTNKFNDSRVEHMYNGSHKDAQNDALDSVQYAQDGNTGAFYNWPVATAGYDTPGNASSGNSSKSICPKGWKLPTSTDSGEFNALYSVYSDNRANMDTAFNLTAYIGFYASGQLVSTLESATFTRWWSSSIYSSTTANGLVMYSNGAIHTTGILTRYEGFSVRCVAR